MATSSRIAPDATSATSSSRGRDIPDPLRQSRSASNTMALLSGVQSIGTAARSSPAPALHLPVVICRAAPPSAATTNR